MPVPPPSHPCMRSGRRRDPRSARAWRRCCARFAPDRIVARFAGRQSIGATCRQLWARTHELPWSSPAATTPRKSGGCMSELILHQYAMSPFSEKVRKVLAVKQLAWRAVEQPMWNPKPQLVPLTGGYRRIPVLQLGADVYCDTACILREIE